MGKVRYDSGDEIVEVKVLGGDGGRLDVRRSNLSDSKSNWRWLKWLIDKWGIRFQKDHHYIDVESEFLKY